MDITEWLHALGLGEYAPAFRANQIDDRVLPGLTADDLKELGVVAIGPRRRLLDAIAALRARPSEAATERPQDAERRFVTALFCDLVGSTPLSARLDPEDLQALIADYYRRVSEVIGGRGGFVGHYSGDGVMAYFGYPEAHEDDAERAVRAGLAVVEAVRQMPGPEKVQVRIGIATGLVVAGDFLGNGSAGARTAVGETPNVAARLQTIAPPDTIVMAARTKALLGGLFEYEDLGPQVLKGLTGAVQAWRVLGESAQVSRFEALRAPCGGLPLVGRSEELELLLQCWRRAQAGEGQVAILSGEAGIGKSRLVAAVLACIAGDSHWRRTYFCSPHRQDSALHPIIAQLQRAAGFMRDDTIEAKWAKLEVALAPLVPRRSDVALIGDLLSLPHRHDLAPAPMTPQVRRQRTVEALLGQLTALAERRPVMVVFEDLHWADPSTCDLLDRLVRDCVAHPILLVLTARPDFEPFWARAANIASMALGRLDRNDSRTLVDAMKGPHGALAADVAEAIVDRTDGVPLFLEELTRAALEADIDPGVMPQVVAMTLPRISDVPVSLHGPLLARLDRLGPIAREVAQTGATLGRDFGHDLLLAVAGHAEPEVARALDRLIAAGLLFRSGVQPAATYAFKHALVQDVAYSTLLRARRRQLHATIARTLVDAFPEQRVSQPELVAHHFTEAGVIDQAIAYWLEAGRRSAERSSDREAVRQLQRGLDLIGTMPQSAERDRMELAFQLALGTPLMSVHGYTAPQVAAAYRRASVLCERLGDTEGLIMTLHALRAHLMVRGETRASVHLAEQCMSVAASYAERDYRLLGYYGIGTSRMQLGELVQARCAFEKVAELYDPERDRLLATRCVFDPCAAALAVVSPVLWALGHVDQARRAAEGALRCADERAHAHTSGLTGYFGGGLLAELLRDVAAAQDHASAVIGLADQHNMPAWHGNGTIVLGWALGRRDNLREGTALVQQGLAELDAIGTVWHRPHHLGILAELHAQQGDCAAALRLIDEARQHILMTDAHFWSADICRIEGELHRRAGAPDDKAESCFAAAIETARRQAARSFELRAASSLARLRRDQGRWAEAREILQPVYEWFTEGLDTRDLTDAKALLDELQA